MPISHTMKNHLLKMLYRSPLWHFVPLMHGLHKISKGVLWCLAPRCNSGSFKFCELQCGLSVVWTCLFSTPHSCSYWLRSGEFGVQINTFNSLSCNSNHSCTLFTGCIILLKEAFFPIQYAMVMKGCTLLDAKNSISQQNIAQSIMLLPKAFLHPLVHSVAIPSPCSRLSI